MPLIMRMNSNLLSTLTSAINQYSATGVPAKTPLTQRLAHGQQMDLPIYSHLLEFLHSIVQYNTRSFNAVYLLIH